MMKVNQKVFLEQFDQPLRKHIINFCNVISKTEFDVYVILARKAACFIDTLMELDLIEINGQIVSDRIFEYDSEWLKNKSVAIIDDTIISGTSIYKLIQKAKKVNVKDIKVFAFCINEYWFVDEMLFDDNLQSYLQVPFLRLDHTTSLNFCKQIVDALSIIPRPYNIDFPIYEKIRFSKSNMQQLYKDSCWKIAETTTALQRENDIASVTLNPKKCFIEEFNKSLGFELSKTAHLKIRFYFRKMEDLQGNINYLSKAVPYIIFNPIEIKYVDRLLLSICNSEHTKTDSLLKILQSPSSKLLFVQYYFSERLYRLWKKYTDLVFSKEIKFQVNERSLYYLFSPELVNIIKSFKFEEELDFAEYFFLDESILPSENSKLVNPEKVLNTILKRFLDLYYLKELPARRIVKRIKKKAFNDINYVEIVNRLDDGISINSIKNDIYEYVNNISDTNSILSSFLDNYIDNGIIVPITVHKGNLLYRGFRHGEEIIWGNYNNHLLASFYKRYLTVTNATELPRFAFQKLLVLFLKIGLRNGILEEYNIVPPQNLKVNLLSVRSYLFGQVVVYREIEPNEEIDYIPIIDDENKSYWASEMLIDLGGIIQNRNENYEFDFPKITNNYEEHKEIGEPQDIDETDIDIAEEIADVFGYLKTNRLLTNDDFVLLTSCTNIHDNTSSLAAELQIFANSFQSYKNVIQSNIANSSFTINRLQDLRERKFNFLWTAINSGKDKYCSYKNDDAFNLIESISEKLKETDSFKERAWRKYWKTEIELSKNDKNELNLLNDSMGYILLDLNIAYRAIHILIYELLRRGKHFEDFYTQKEKERCDLKLRINEIKLQIKNLEDNTDKTAVDQIVIDKLKEEKNKLERLNDNISNVIRYWEAYPAKNKKKIEDAVKITPSYYKTAEIAKQILLDIYIEQKNKDLTSLLRNSITLTEELLDDVKESLKCFKLLVPQWGKVQQRVKYNSIIHVNSLSKEQSEREKIALIIKMFLEEFELMVFGDDAIRKTITLLKAKDANIGNGYIIGGRGQFHHERMLNLSCLLLEKCKEFSLDITMTFYPNYKDGVNAYYSTMSKNFDVVKENIFEHLEKNMEQNTIIVHDEKHTYTNDVINKKLDYKYYIDKSENIMNITRNYIKMKKNTENQKIIGIVTALPKELAAVKLILDHEDTSFKSPENDNNDYAAGYINTINGGNVKVIIALMKEMGTNNAATTATNLLRSFSEIEDVIICGIAGGTPNIDKPEDHVRLGDIVVSNKNGVLQYDNIKETSAEITIRDASSKPSAKLLGKINLLQSELESNRQPWLDYIKRYQGQLRNSVCPSVDTDILKKDGKIVKHPNDEERITGQPRVFYGAIGSSNTLLKNEKKRDFLRDTYGVRAIEMEASGIADGTWSLSKGYLIIRGIVDYCNTDKNDNWHNYAAICAACYAKCVIERL